MNISRKWLREFVDITATDKEYDSVMTLAGQKVETTERMDAEIKNVVVGKVLSMKKHENSDHRWVCMVDCGSGEPVQIVTGAQNVHEGDLVPVAQHNSYLPGGIHITKGKLRGVESCGMLCSYKELGLTEHDCPEAYADGIWILNDEGCEVGEDMNVVIGNDDSIVEFEITNNRPDCYSLIGLARETAAAFNVPMKHHEPVVKGGAEGNLCDLLDVDVQADDLCPRYTARMVRNVKIAPSPKWMRQRLRSAGIRPINNIVDITNYVMVEYGQPMHAFDYRYVKGGKIVVRRAGEDKTLTTLDGNVRTLQPDMLVIADETKPVGLAGVMGGENSEIVIREKLLTHGEQHAVSEMDVFLNGKNTKTQVISRSVAQDHSSQIFYPRVQGNNLCFGHVQCDAILMGGAKVRAIPEITCNHVDASLIHEAAIGRIAGDQILKLMTLGLSAQQAEEKILEGFLR